MSKQQNDATTNKQSVALSRAFSLSRGRAEEEEDDEG